MNQMNRVFDIVMVGDRGVGKTSLVKRCVGEEAGSVSYIDMTLNNGSTIGLRIWDPEVLDSSVDFGDVLGKADGALIVFDCTDPSSMLNVRYWSEQIDRHTATPINKIVVCNKSDVLSPSAFDEVILESKRMTDALFYSGLVEVYETSAETGKHVDPLFRLLGSKVYSRRLNDIERSRSEEARGPRLDRREPLLKRLLPFCCKRKTNL